MLGELIFLCPWEWSSNDVGFVQNYTHMVKCKSIVFIDYLSTSILGETQKKFQGVIKYLL